MRLLCTAMHSQTGDPGRVEIAGHTELTESEHWHERAVNRCHVLDARTAAGTHCSTRARSHQLGHRRRS